MDENKQPFVLTGAFTLSLHHAYVNKTDSIISMLSMSLINNLI